MPTETLANCPEASLRPSATPGEVCGAAPAADGLCLAHLSQDALQEHLASVHPGSDIDAHGVVFTAELLELLLIAATPKDQGRELGRADFHSATFTEDAGFGGVTFTEDAYFDSATFTKSAGFGDATFTEGAYFGDATFTKDADFRSATFTKDAGFGDATFTEGAYFGDATFTKDAYFDSATFTEDADFRGATFTRDSDFHDATFTRKGNFDRATITGRMTMACSAGELLWRGAELRGELAVEAAAALVDLAGARASGRVRLRLRGACVNLSEAVFTGPITVHGLQTPIGGVDETRIVWRGAAMAGGPVPGVRVESLREVDAERLVLTDVDLSGCHFAGMHQLEKIRLDGRCRFAFSPGGTRQVLAEERLWRAADRGREEARSSLVRRLRSARAARWDPQPSALAPVGVDAARLEVLYRQLRKALEDSKNEPGAADFYYSEMQMRRAGGRQRHALPERTLVWLYWLVSGYGLRAGRAIVALLIAVSLIAVGVKYAGFPGKPVPYIDAWLYSMRSAFVINVKSAVLPETVTRWGEVFRIILRITVPLLLGLAALALRNRVKR
jgi:uncharacterized protein YjbI with pentapeptide repeats